MSGFWRDRRVLVTGGVGFLGSHVVERLVAAGAEVTVPSRAGSPRNLAAVRERVRLLPGDLENLAFCEACAAGQDTVLHLAAHLGAAGHGGRQPAGVLRRNMLPALQVAEAAARAGVARLVVASSASVYAGLDAGPCREEDGFVGVPTGDDAYGWAKRFLEVLAGAWAREHGGAVAVVRLFNCYGPRDDFRPGRARVIPSLVRRTLEGEDPLVVWGDGTATRSFLYVEDAVTGLLEAARRSPGPEAVNLGSDEEMSVAALARLVVEACGTGTALEFDASRPSGRLRSACSTARAREILGFEARVPLREGLRRTVDWYREVTAGAGPGSCAPAPGTG